MCDTAPPTSETVPLTRILSREPTKPRLQGAVVQVLTKGASAPKYQVNQRGQRSTQMGNTSCSMRPPVLIPCWTHAASRHVSISGKSTGRGFCVKTYLLVGALFYELHAGPSALPLWPHYAQILTAASKLLPFGL